jgi:hypothetical protein
MNGLIITTTNKADLKLFTELANRIGIKAKPLTDDELLDLGLLKAMEEGKTTKFVSKDKIMSKLKKNGNKVSGKV